MSAAKRQRTSSGEDVVHLSVGGTPFAASLEGRGDGLREMHAALLASIARARELGLVHATDDDDPRIRAYARQTA